MPEHVELLLCFRPVLDTALALLKLTEWGGDAVNKEKDKIIITDEVSVIKEIKSGIKRERGHCCGDGHLL